MLISSFSFLLLRVSGSLVILKIEFMGFILFKKLFCHINYKYLCLSLLFIFQLNRVILSFGGKSVHAMY